MRWQKTDKPLFCTIFGPKWPNFDHLWKFSLLWHILLLQRLHATSKRCWVFQLSNRYKRQQIVKLKSSSPRCSGWSNNMNLQRSRYARLKWDFELKYEKWSQNTDLNNQNVEFSRPLTNGHEWIYPWQQRTFMFKSIKI